MIFIAIHQAIPCIPPRSSGPGGQSVNMSDSRVQMSFKHGISDPGMGSTGLIKESRCRALTWQQKGKRLLTVSI